MMPHHHLDDTTLLSYCTASLPLALSLVVSAHLDMCPICRNSMRLAEQTGGVALTQRSPAQAGKGAQDGAWRTAMLASLDSPLPPVPETAAARGFHRDEPHTLHGRVPRRLAPEEDLLPVCVRPYFGERISAVRWRFLAPGVHIARARGVGEAKLMLFKVAPGFSMPPHSHGNSELTLVLKGAYHDALGHFSRGDIADLDGDIEHQPVTDLNEPCICLAATDAPLRFSTLIPRLFRPVFGL